ncbi:MAG: phosphatase PAP2 family protein [Clostridia bacterium]|nr:phosphatase PAP2 family protein [Clostridia bacterium]
MNKKSYNLLEKDFWLERKYALWAFFLPAYILVFFLVENIVDGQGPYWVSYLPIDDAIPFLEGFIIPYYFWYPLLVGVGLYGLIKEEYPFKRYMTLLAVTFFAAEIFFLLVPNGQDLRPETFEHHNLCTKMIQMIYSVDTNTNVFPSVHIIGALVACIGMWDFKTLKRRNLQRAFVLVITVLICISTVFVKQHSVLDILGGCLFVAIGYIFVYVLPKKKWKDYEH